MQPIARDGLTADQVRGIITADLPGYDLQVTLLGQGGADDVDITAEVLVDGSELERGNYDTVHGKCRLRVTRELDWGRDRLAVTVTVTAGGQTIVVPAGVYLLSTPSTVAGDDEQVWEVDGYDLLEVVAHPHGATYVAEQGRGHLECAAELLTDAGLTVQFAGAGEDVLLDRDRVFPIDENTTTLNIVNALLERVGFQAVWADWNGIIRSQPYRSPADRGEEWTFDVLDEERTTVAERRTLTRDFFDAPNRWVFVIDDPEVDTADDEPVEGDGIYTVDNVADGPTSQDARGRVITRVERVQAASQAALVSIGDRMVETDKRVTEELELEAAANPLHWHFDVVRVNDPDLGVNGRFVVRRWVLPLDGSDMRFDMRAV